MPLYALALEISLLFSCWLALGALQRDRYSSVRSGFLALCVSCTLWSGGVLLFERGAIDAELGNRIAFLGIQSLPTVWFWTAAQVAGARFARRMPWLPFVLLTPEAALYSLFYLGPWSHLFYPAGAAHGIEQAGPLWDIHVAYSYGLAGAGTAIAFWGAGRAWIESNRGAAVRTVAAQRAWIAVASLAPLLGNLHYLWMRRDGSPDLTPVLFVFALIALRRPLLSGGLLQVLPISQRGVLDVLPAGVLLADSANIVVDANRAAESHLGAARDTLVGRSVEAVLADEKSDAWSATRVSMAGMDAGRLVMLGWNGAYQALRAGQIQTGLLLRPGVDGLWELDIQSGEVALDPDWVRYQGYEPEQLATVRQLSVLVSHPHELRHTVERLGAHLRGEVPFYETEHRLRTAAGEWRWYRDRGQLIEWDQRGRPLRLVGVSIDITEERALADECERLRSDLAELDGAREDEKPIPIARRPDAG